MLPEGYELRPLQVGDGAALAAAFVRNREHLAPWDPDRPEDFYTPSGQEAEVGRNVVAAEQGRTFVYLIWHDNGTRSVVGRVMISNVVRGVLQSGTLGYWVDHEHLGRGVASGAVAMVAEDAHNKGLHRLEAGTMLDNVASQAVLRRSGFTEIGVAQQLLLIGGEWRDHLLFQRILGD